MEHFRLGLELVELAATFLSDQNLQNVSEPVLNELAAQTHETVHLAVPVADEVVYIAKVDNSNAMRSASRVGARMPMYCASLGKVIWPTIRLSEWRRSFAGTCQRALRIPSPHQRRCALNLSWCALGALPLMIRRTR